MNLTINEITENVIFVNLSEYTDDYNCIFTFYDLKHHEFIYAYKQSWTSWHDFETDYYTYNATSLFRNKDTVCSELIKLIQLCPEWLIDKEIERMLNEN
jgi:hypothetical protein